MTRLTGRELAIELRSALTECMVAWALAPVGESLRRLAASRDRVQVDLDAVIAMLDAAGDDPERTELALEVVSWQIGPWNQRMSRVPPLLLAILERELNDAPPDEIDDDQG